jgi:WD40 repeat protein
MLSRTSTMRALAAAAALVVAGCAESSAPRPSPVTAEKVLDVPGIQPVVNAVALSPDGSLVAVGDMDGELVTRELPSGTERWRWRTRAGWLGWLVFSADGSRLAAIAQERYVTVWQASTGVDVASMEAGGNTRAVAFHPTEATLAVGGGGHLHFLATEGGEPRRSLPNAFSGERVYAVAFSSDGQLLAAVSDQGTLKLWAWPELTLRTSLQMSKSIEATAPVSLVLGRQATRVAVNGLLGRVHVVDLVKEREERTFDNTPEAPGHGMHAEMRGSLAFSQDGDWLFAPDMHDRGVRILHVPSGKAYPVLRGDGPFYKAMSISIPAGLIALLRPGDDQGRGPYGLEIWRLIYRAS